MIPAGQLVGSHDIVLVTLDSLRHDVAVATRAAGRTPCLDAALPPWQQRETPASFTLPAHQAFLAGFLPIPAGSARPPRMFGARFEGAVGVRSGSFVFDEPSLPQALAARGYHTACVGGVGFFSGRGALGSVLPSLFAEHRWSPASGPASRVSAAAVVDHALDVIAGTPPGTRLFLLVNVATTHAPTHLHLDGAHRDGVDTQAAALAAADADLGRLLAGLRRPTLLVVCADHGDCFGEDGRHGHGIAHPLVLTVPYAEVVLT